MLSYQHWRGTHATSVLVSTLKMEAAFSSNMLVLVDCGSGFLRLVTKYITCLRNSLSTFICRWTTSFWCAIRTCCWEKPLPWWCWYSCYCAWLYRLCTGKWYVNCYKFVCMLFFKHLQYVNTFIVFMCFYSTGLYMEGIYKVSGIKSKVQHLRRLYNIREAAQLSDFELPVITSLLKQFLRLLS